MRSFLTIVCIMAMLRCSNKEPDGFVSVVRKIIFNPAMGNNDKDLISFYKSLDYLSLDPPVEGYTIYPPLSALRQDTNQKKYIFRFKKHPYVSFSFREGELIIPSGRNDNKEIIEYSVVKFIFHTKDEAEIAYRELVEMFGRLSTRKRFSDYKDSKYAEFTNDNSKNFNAIGFTQGKGDIIANGYVIVFALGNDLNTDNS